MKKRIAITGGIGSGKSCVLQKLRELGYATLSCDEIYKEIIKEPNYIQTIAQMFPEVVEKEGINRRKLADIVFSDKQKREALEKVAHPLIMSSLYKSMDNANTSLVFAEVPLLFEGGYEKDFDAVILVKREEVDRINAVAKRDGLSIKEIEQRIKSQNNFQTSLSKGKKALIWVLDNNKDLAMLEIRLLEILKEIEEKLT